jgi:hypothetical protein
MAGHQRTAETPAGGGRADTPAGDGQADTGGGALHYGWWACMLTLGGKGGFGGSPNAEAGGKGASTVTAIPQRTRAPVRVQRPCTWQRPWQLAKASGFILAWKSLTGVISVRLLRSCVSPGSTLKEGDWHIVCCM